MPDIPSIIRGGQDEYKFLYYSDPIAALRVPVTLQSGYGVLKKGTILALNNSALTTGGQGQLLPYNPSTFDGSEYSPGRAYLVANGAASGNVVYVTMDDSYKFKVGDDLIINDDTTTTEDLGAITAIDRTSERQRAKITFTTSIGSTDFTTGRHAHVLVQASAANAAANNWSDAVGILEKSVDTGTGVDAKGAVATLIIGNCVLYEGMLTNLDTKAKTAISATTFGQYVYIR